MLVVDAKSPSSMDTVHITRQLERNGPLGIKDFFINEHPDGEVEYAGPMPLERAELLIRSLRLTEASLVTSAWLPSTPPPPLACSLKRILVVPDKLKTTATAYMKWILSKQKLKKGQPGFLGWHYPCDRARFTLTDSLLGNFTKSTLAMEQIVPWANLAKLRNGLASGDTTMLTSHCGLTSWLAVLKVFLEVSWCVVFAVCAVTLVVTAAGDLIPLLAVGCDPVPGAAGGAGGRGGVATAGMLVTNKQTLFGLGMRFV